MNLRSASADKQCVKIAFRRMLKENDSSTLLNNCTKNRCLYFANGNYRKRDPYGEMLTFFSQYSAPNCGMVTGSPWATPPITKVHGTSASVLEVLNVFLCFLFKSCKRDFNYKKSALIKRRIHLVKSGLILIPTYKPTTLRGSNTGDMRLTTHVAA